METNILIILSILIGFFIYRRNSLRKYKKGKLSHREIYKQKVGPIPFGWHIHHINGLKGDNRISNLIAVPAHFHAWIHECQYLDSTQNFKPYSKCIWSKSKIKKELAKYLQIDDKRYYKLKTERAKAIAKFGD